MQHRGAYRHHSPPPENFGDEVTADHIVSWGDSIGIDGEEYAVAMLDRATKWIYAYPTASKTTEDTVAAFKEFSGRDKIKRFYSDKAPELAAASRESRWCHDVSVPGRPQLNGAERNVRK